MLPNFAVVFLTATMVVQVGGVEKSCTNNRLILAQTQMRQTTGITMLLYCFYLILLSDIIILIPTGENTEQLNI